MIHYSLVCESKHAFEGWFASAAAYDTQVERGIVTCRVCNSTKVEKALMAPAVSRGNEKLELSAGPQQKAQMMELMKAFRRKVMEEADYVGDKFAEEARKMHFSEIEARGIYGEATRDEVASLLEEGVDFMPLPNLPEEHN